MTTVCRVAHRKAIRCYWLLALLSYAAIASSDQVPEACLPGSACWAQTQTVQSMGEQTQRISNQLDLVARKHPQFAALSIRLSELSDQVFDMRAGVRAGHMVSKEDLDKAIAAVELAMPNLKDTAGAANTDFRLALEDAQKFVVDLRAWWRVLEANQISRQEVSSMVQQLETLGTAISAAKTAAPVDPEADPDAQEVGNNGRQIDPKAELAQIFPDATVQTTIVAVPDPRVPKTRRNFDLVQLAIDRAMNEAGFRFNRFFYPWKNDGPPEVAIVSATVLQEHLACMEKAIDLVPVSEEQTDKKLIAINPLVERSSQSFIEKDICSLSQNAKARKSLHEQISTGLVDFGLLVYVSPDEQSVQAIYLVAERASQGPHAPALNQALFFSRVQNQKNPAHPATTVIAPFFESSLPRWRKVLASTEIPRLNESGADENAAARNNFNFEASAVVKSSDQPALSRFQLPPNVYLIRGLEAPASRELSLSDRKQIAMRRLMWRQRNELELDADLGNEWPDSFATSTTARTMELWLNQELEKMRGKDSILIDTDNVLDQIFISRRIKEINPGMHQTFARADLLFAHPSFLSATRGAIALGNLERKIKNGDERFSFANDESAQIFCKVITAVSAKQCEQSSDHQYLVTRHGLEEFGTGKDLRGPSAPENFLMTALFAVMVWLLLESVLPSSASWKKVGATLALVWIIVVYRTNATDAAVAKTLLLLPIFASLTFAVVSVGRVAQIKFSAFSMFLVLVVGLTLVLTLPGFANDKVFDAALCAALIFLLVGAYKALNRQNEVLDQLTAGMDGAIDGLNYVGHKMLPAFATPFVAKPDSNPPLQSPMLGVSRLHKIRNDVAEQITLMRGALLIGIVACLMITFACYLQPLPHQNFKLATAVFALLANSGLLWYALIRMEKHELLCKIYCRGTSDFQWSARVLTYLLVPLVSVVIISIIMMQPGTTVLTDALTDVFGVMLSR